MKELRAQGYKPRAEQLDESWLVRIRERGHKPLEATFESEAAATQFIEKTSEERKRGLFIDYTAALKVTFADILVRYLLEEPAARKVARCSPTSWSVGSRTAAPEASNCSPNTVKSFNPSTKLQQLQVM